jgi:class I fructose-bisphosphate aldolase
MMATPYSTPNLINTYRMQRLFPAGQAAIICPIDHGIIFPRELMKGLEEPVKVLNRLKTQGATGFMMSPGLVKQTQVEMGQAGHLSRVMAVDGFYSLTDATKGIGNLIATVEDAVSLGVDCVKLLMPWNVSVQEKVKLTERLGKIVSDAGKWQMPVMIEPVLLGDPRSPAVVAAEFEVSRIAYDIGADIVKIAFPGPDYTAKLVQELKVPLVIAGGPMTGRNEDAVREIQDAVAAGAQGLIVGRNVWSRSPADAERMMTDIVRIAREHHVRLW